MQQLETLRQQADEQLAIERAEGIRKAKEIIDEYQLSAHDLGFVKTQHIPAKKDPKKTTFAVKKPKTPKPPRYRDPESGATWSGYGHQPRWMTGNRDEYLIEPQQHKQSKRAA
jgi:DNA-binding protein H-NS